MTKKELKKLSLDEACAKLCAECDNITTYDTLKDFAISLLNDDNVGFAIHILQAIYNSDTEAEYYIYDYSMGTLETPQAIMDKSDLEEFLED